MTVAVTQHSSWRLLFNLIEQERYSIWIPVWNEVFSCCPNHLLWKSDSKQTKKEIFLKRPWVEKLCDLFISTCSTSLVTVQWVRLCPYWRKQGVLLCRALWTMTGMYHTGTSPSCALEKYVEDIQVSFYLAVTDIRRLSRGICWKVLCYIYILKIVNMFLEGASCDY